MDKEKEFWQSFTDPVAVSKAIWADEDKKVAECLKMIVPSIRSKLNVDRSVFDLGCGIGRLLHPLSEIYPYVDFVGIDFSEPMIQFAKKNENITYVLNDGKTIPFDDNYFDAGYSMIMFQHITNESVASYLKEVARVLKNGGVFVFQIVEGDQHHFLSHNAIIDDVIKWVQDAGMSVKTITGGIFSVWIWVTAIKP